MIKVGVCAALVLSLVLGACSAAAATPAPSAVTTAGPSALSAGASGQIGAASGSAETGSPEAISTGAGLARIRGHYAVSILLYEAGDQQGALTHAGHPVAEILIGIKHELDEHGVRTPDLDAALRTAADAVDAKAPVAVVMDLDAKVATLTDAAEAAVAGTASSSVAFRGSVIASLLVTAGHEYEEAIATGTVKELIEYQDGFGFVREAKRMYALIEPQVRARAAPEADLITGAFATLDAALVAPQPPAMPAAVADVDNASNMIGHELTEAVGAAVMGDVVAADVVADIGEHLDEMLVEYRAGRMDSALDVAAEAYLGGYELIEAAVIMNAKSINDELEPLLGSQMRARMRAGATVAEMEQLVARARTLLAQALPLIQAASH